VTTQRLIAAAAAAFERRDVAKAERDCRAILTAEPDNPEAMHLLGLVRRQAGDAAGAEPLLRRSVELCPARSEFRLNLSNLLSAGGRLDEAQAELRRALAAEPSSRAARLALARLLVRVGRYAEAESEARLLLVRDDRDAEAWAAVAGAQRDRGKLAEAEASYRKALAVRPAYAVARHNLGALLGQLERAEESLAELDRAAQLGATGPELHFNRARALAELGRFDEADAALVAAVKQWPEALDAQIMLAKLRYMRGDANYTRELAAAVSRSANPALSLALGDLLRRGGQLQAAHEILRSVADRLSGAPQVISSLAVVLQELGDLEQALKHARAASAALPEDPGIVENLIAILLQSGNADEASPWIVRERGRAPLDGRWLAYEATAARLMGDPRYHELYDYEHFVRAFDLEPPAGYDSMEDFNAELAARLNERHKLRAHPLDQSLRHGTQTSRSLLADRDPVIGEFFGLLDEPLRTYRTELGFDADHPFTGRNRGATKLAGCWSVRLFGGGYHVNHLHPRGWISSAYYVALPAETADRESKIGWIKFGEPRMQTPGAEPAHFIEPRVGRLVLFPSYMWHGTIPIHGDEPRLAIAFDAVPHEAPLA
jgi:uncharacterized protein (TIGR02466 family)